MVETSSLEKSKAKALDNQIQLKMSLLYHCFKGPFQPELFNTIIPEFPRNTGKIQPEEGNTNPNPKSRLGFLSAPLHPLSSVQSQGSSKAT